ncbi:RNA repair transcriptional activator RtcR [bacterium]|nr:RNA repair transcriptional activator RtcR [bacterium]
MTAKRNVVIGLLGVTLDQGKNRKRWSHWRPTVSICQHEDFLVDRFELLFQEEFRDLANVVVRDIESVSPETEVRLTEVPLPNPWDFEGVYGALLDFAMQYKFNSEKERYFVHITTGSHVAQICLFLLTEARYMPGVLLQSSPKSEPRNIAGTLSTVDLDLSKYDAIASRFATVRREGLSFLKDGIETRSKTFNETIERIERVAIASRAPILMMGPTGAGKSRLARRIYELKKQRRRLDGPLIEVNCATIRGEGAMSALFGHTKGAFTGAAGSRDGMLLAANKGILFLDEIGELGSDEQAMLLGAIEEKRFYPLGSDRAVTSDFQLIAGTNRDLAAACRKGQFREDLFARINLWTFRLPGLAERREDIAPNLDYELERFAREQGSRVTINKEARTRFLRFAESPDALWPASFRDLGAAVMRMATLCDGGRINVRIVEEEIGRMRDQWRDAATPTSPGDPLLPRFLSGDEIDALDLFDRVQLEHVLLVCRQSRSLSDAGRTLFQASLSRRKSSNDADRLRKYLAKFGLEWKQIAR